MSEIKQYAVLDYVSATLQKGISGSKLNKISQGKSEIVDGDASIEIEQRFESGGSIAAILISDSNEILYSEELLEEVYRIHEGADHHAGVKAALSIANLIINGLNIEAQLIFYDIKDHFYALNDSYEFENFTEKDIQQFKFALNFGDHIIEVIVINDPNRVSIEADFKGSIPNAVKETIKADIQTISDKINKKFKTDNVLDKIMDLK